MVSPLILMMAGLLADASTCEKLASVTLPGATISSARMVPAGPFVAPAQGRAGRTAACGCRTRRRPWGGRGQAAPAPILPEHCRVRLVLAPSTDSRIEMEVWLPPQNWNGKFQAVGNGGWAGTISYAAMATALAEGYATASNDTGHKGGNALFAIDHPEKLVDFAYRAVHEMTVQVEGDHRVLLRTRAAPVVLERLLDRRAAGADVGAEIPGGLRRDPCRRARQLPDASARVGSGGRGAGAEGSGGAVPAAKLDDGEPGRARTPATRATA